MSELDHHTTVSGASMLSMSMRLGAPESCGINEFDDYMVYLQDCKVVFVDDIVVSLRFSAGCFVYRSSVRGKMIL